jgi:hypothetical protein
VPFLKVQKVTSERMVADGCAHSLIELQTSLWGGNRHLILSCMCAGEFRYQSLLCMWLSIKHHIFGMEREVSFFYIIMFTAVGK